MTAEIKHKIVQFDITHISTVIERCSTSWIPQEDPSQISKRWTFRKLSDHERSVDSILHHRQEARAPNITVPCHDYQTQICIYLLCSTLENNQLCNERRGWNRKRLRLAECLNPNNVGTAKQDEIHS